MNGNKRLKTMKKPLIYLALLSCIAMITGCQGIEEFEEPAQKISMTFYAEIECHPATKTILGAKDENRTRSVLWVPDDKIGIAPSTGGSFDAFANINTEPSNKGTFEGETTLAPSYFAIYPYDENAVISGKSISITLDHVQTYKTDSFEQDAFPMLARSSESDSNGLKFKNLCGLLEVNLTGNEKVTSITFSSDKKVSGTFCIDTGYEEYPEMIADASNSTSTTLNCGEGVQLTTDTPTPFYFVLPPGEYDAFTLMIQTADGKTMLKEGKNPLNLKRSYIAYAGSLAYVESVSFDLSIHGTANSYVITKAGKYKFNASIIGNGISGIIPESNFHTADPNITPVSAEVLWESKGYDVETRKGELISNVSLENGYIHFVSTGREGNALVAVRDNEGEILWSWQLWFTDMPEEQFYTNSNGEFYVLDRNMGATRADKGNGDEWKESVGTLYQWGRKDPNYFSTTDKISLSNFESITASIKQPTSITHGYTWISPMNTQLWSPIQKTIYDPCPVGYRVGNKSLFSSFTLSGEMDKGWNIKYSEGVTAWYPATPYITGGGKDETAITTEGYIWSSDESGPLNGQNLYYTSSSISMRWDRSVADHYPVRCVKDDGYIDPSLPTIEIIGARNITIESASIAYKITSEGASGITESGIVYSTSAGVSIENGIKVPIYSSEYIAELTGLTGGTKYFAKAYATNSYGTSYSKEISFYTEFADFVNLSKYGTSNCYMVSEFGAYTFDASVKGNSSESVGNPVAAKVVWETRNTDASVAVGDIIYDLEYSYGYVRFKATGNPGNALIAVVDANDTIIWSWHIWVTDYDPNLNFCTYLSGAVMMDRNLGALNAGSDAASYGFLYEWGRKDPLIGSANGSTTFATTAPSDLKEFVRPDSPFEYSFANPTHAVGNLVNDNSAWGRVKTKYDPCPVGWRVPNGGPDGVWSGMIYGSPGIVKSGGSWTINPPYSDPATIYPAPGYTEGTQLTLSFPGSALYCWSCDVTNNGGGYGMHLFNRIERELASNKSAEFSVRCMREHDINIVLNTGSATEVTKTSAVIHGSMGYLGTVNLLELGFVWSSTNSTPEIIKDSKTTVDVREGEFSRSLTNLSPGTTYYVRTFATEGNITIYGPVTHFTTQVAAGNEDIPEDDEYDW